ncbi:MAG: fibronectin type III domain-containing protein [Desulfobacter sp.]|nr:MAG: fibronectin type III domain-containing protein [Desulfobacter sp.]
MKTLSHFIVLAVAAAFMLTGLGLVAGCGKKGPPLPPLNDGNIVNPPVSLAYTLDGRRLTLTWEHHLDPVNAKIPPEGFEVFVATKTPEGCTGCPFIFKSAGMVPMPEKVFVYDLEPDLNYYFRVQAVGSKDLRSEFSATINIERE